MRKGFSDKFRHYCPMCFRDWLIFFGVMLCSALICLLLQRITTSDVHVPLIFVLTNLIISILTDGYFYGILGAFVSVIGVNLVFTYPYMKLDFSIYGYPLTFLTMLAVGIASSTMATGLKEQQKLRLEAEREKTKANLLRSISHDLRTSLTAISGSVSSVLDTDSSLSEAEKRDLLINAKEDAEWLHQMVENLLSITRINSTGKITKTEEILEEVIGEAVLNFKKREKTIQVYVSIPEEPLFVPMDPMLIEQVLMNLFENAVAHGRHTDTIEVTASQDNSYAAIKVSDNGVGIDPQVLDHLFDGSLQFEGKNGSDGNRHMGIGLTLCHTIMEAHGGTIAAGNRTTGGAWFEIRLPLKPEDGGTEWRSK